MSNQTVLVAVDDGPRTVAYAPPGSAGMVYVSLGIGPRRLTVLEPDCSSRVTLQTGDHGLFSVVINPDSSASIAAAANSGVGVALRALGVCGAQKSWCASDPLPSDVPKPQDQEPIPDC
jgi:hypothetical protein